VSRGGGAGFSAGFRASLVTSLNVGRVLDVVCGSFTESITHLLLRTKQKGHHLVQVMALCVSVALSVGYITRCMSAKECRR
jgi:hypothetical protein